MKYTRDQKDFELFRSGDKKVIEKIYFEFDGKLKAYIKENYKDFESYCGDLIQEAITIVLELNKTPILTCELMTYLIKIARNQLNNRIRNDKNLVFYNRLANENAIVESLYVIIEQNEKRLIVNEALYKLTKRCRKLLETFCRTLNCNVAAKKLYYKSEQVFNVKKSECMKELIRILEDDPRYLELINEKE